MTDDTPTEDKVHVLHPARPPARPPSEDDEVKRAMRRLLGEWKQLVDAGDLTSLVLIGGLTADGRTMDAYASIEDPLTTVGRLRQVEHSILSNKE